MVSILKSVAILSNRTGAGRKLKQPVAEGSLAPGLLSLPLRFKGEAIIPDSTGLRKRPHEGAGERKPLPIALSSPFPFSQSLWLSYDFPKRTAVPAC